MKRVFLRVFLTLTLLCLSSCKKEKAEYKTKEVDGILYTFNKNIPSRLDFSIKPILQYKIDFKPYKNSAINMDYLFAFDTQYNLFVFHRKTMAIKKYNNKGKLIKEFGIKGHINYKFGSPVNSGVALFIDHNLLYVYMLYQQKIFTYDLEGNFISKKNCKLLKRDIDSYRLYQGSLVPINTENILELLSLGNPEYFRQELKILNIRKKSIKIKNIINKKIKKSKDYLSFMSFKYAYKNGKIYIAKNSKNVFQIDIYDTSPQKISVINKNYTKVKYPLTYRMMSGLEFRESILDIKVDKLNRIWIISAEDNEMGDTKNNPVYQIFDAKGMYLNKVILDLDIVIRHIFFLNDKMLVYGLDKNNEEAFPKLYIFNY